MNIERANEIVESAEKVEVKHKGVPVWIATVDDGNKTARVYPENNPEDERTVPVEELEEETSLTGVINLINFHE